MILDAIFGAVLGVIRGVLALLPEWAPDPDAVADVAATITGAATGTNAFFPMVTIVICLTALIGLKIILSGWELVRAVWDMLPLT